MLRIAEQFHASDLGRQRQGNEDNYFVRAPLFVVADGMGGAQAGEVASEMAVESFDAGIGDGSPDEGLVRIIQEANRRIHDRSRSDEQAAGMGTTCTAAYVGDSAVTVAHVGDSRAYLWRGGELTRLTRDHSLVGELVARGKLTEEQAEAHPQRSVITRALGPEREVTVDVETFAAQDGDVYLLCSDGLTSMIHEPGVRPVMERMTDLDQAGRALIAAANEAGGRDNITVILFRLEDVDGAGGGGATGRATAARSTVDEETGEYDTFEGEAVPGPRQGTSRPSAAHTRVRDEESMRSEDVAHAVRAADEQEAAYRASGTVALSAIEPRARAEPIEEAPRRTVTLPDGTSSTKAGGPKRRRRFRIRGGVVVALVLLAMVLGGFWAASQAVYFVGTDADRGNTVTIYRGLPVDLPLGLKLYSRYQGSGVTLQSVPEARRKTFTDHKLRSKDDAENLVIQLERGQIDS
jgi:serine/threonine protein phosphatase PrpC